MPRYGHVIAKWRHETPWIIVREGPPRYRHRQKNGNSMPLSTCHRKRPDVVLEFEGRVDVHEVLSFPFTCIEFWCSLAKIDTLYENVIHATKLSISMHKIILSQCCAYDEKRLALGDPVPIYVLVYCIVSMPITMMRTRSMRTWIIYLEDKLITSHQLPKTYSPLL